jgi:hypothetical protein
MVDIVKTYEILVTTFLIHQDTRNEKSSLNFVHSIYLQPMLLMQSTK